MWIKNQANENKINYLNISNLDLKNMGSNNIKILTIGKEEKKILLAKKGIIKNQKFILNEVTIFDINKEEYNNYDEYIFNINFTSENIIDSILDYKYIPYYNYYNHLKNLQKFNLHSNEISLYYLSEITKPFFLIILGFIVMGYSAKFKRNENFFKILFISILIGFLIFLLKEIVITLTTSLNISYILSYAIIFCFPLIIGLYQIVKIESD